MQNIDCLREISVIEVAERLGLKVLHGNKSMCFSGHDTKTPSLSFHVKKNYWYCFGCAKGGDTISLVQLTLNLDFRQACEWLGSAFGIATSTSAMRYPSPYPIFKPKFSKQEVDIEYPPDSEVYEWVIKSTCLSEKGIQYLCGVREYTKELVNKFEIRDIENPKEFIRSACKKWGEERLIKCGLVRKTIYGLSPVWHEHMIIFPFFDQNDRVINLQGRNFSNTGQRYVNLSGIKTSLYNLALLKNIKSNEYLYFCEGITDTLTAIQYKLNAIGVIGASGFKAEWAEMFTRYKLRMMLDNDAAGETFAKKIANIFLAHGKRVRPIRLDKGKDLSEFVKLNKGT